MSAQLPLFEPPRTWTAPNIADLPTDWGSGRVAVDTETWDEQLTTLGPGVRRGAYIAGVSLAFEDGPAFYLPIRHAGGGNMDTAQVINYLRTMGQRFTGTLCGANLGYDLDFLEEEGITFPQVRWFRDVQVADPLINELHLSYSLESISQRWELPGKDESQLISALAAYGFKGTNAKKGIAMLPAAHVGAYGEQDARLPLALLRRQEREIDAQDLWDIYNLESRVLPVLVRMRRRGVAVDEDRLSQVEDWARTQQQEALDAANHHITGHRLGFQDITNTNVLGKVLTSLGLELPRTRTGKLSVTKDVLENLNHPVGEHLRRAKKMSTLRTTFCQGVRDHLVRGRAHCTFNQLRRQKDDGSGETEGAAYGRLSSSNFNFQNQPARDPEIGPMWRSIYVPDTGLWAALDYSQQEPRHAVNAALRDGPRAIGEAAFESAREAARRYREDPTMDFHDMMTRMIHGDDLLERSGKDAFKQARKNAKQVFLGLSYGMGGPKLCHDLGLPTAWRMMWWEGRHRRHADFPTHEEAVARRRAGEAAGYQVRVFEVAGTEGQEIMNTFDARVPFVRRVAQHSQDIARSQGYVLTMGGRRCRFPVMADGGYDWLHKAFNRRIQGNSADQTKMAIVELDAQGFNPQIQVHDEVDFSAESEAQAQEGGRIMEQVMEMEVPMKVDVELGTSWGDSM